jgi:hypothetical protein
LDRPLFNDSLSIAATLSGSLHPLSTCMIQPLFLCVFALWMETRRIAGWSLPRTPVDIVLPGGDFDLIYLDWFLLGP